MQATISLAEDVWRPRYLCPLDLTMVLRATGADETKRNRGLIDSVDKLRMGRYDGLKYFRFGLQRGGVGGWR